MIDVINEFTSKREMEKGIASLIHRLAPASFPAIHNSERSPAVMELTF